MELPEPEMKRIHCSDPHENPAAGRLAASWLESEAPRTEQTSQTAEKTNKSAVRLPSFCLPLSEVVKTEE